MPSARKSRRRAETRGSKTARTPPIRAKVVEFRGMVNRTLRAAQHYKSLGILSAAQVNQCARTLEDIYEGLAAICPGTGSVHTTDAVTRLQSANDDLSAAFRTYGTSCMKDLVAVCLGANYVESLDTPETRSRWDTVVKHAHPIGYKLLPWKTEPKNASGQTVIAKNRIVEDFTIVESASTLDCFDLARTSSVFHTKVHGIKIAFQCPQQRATLVVSALVDDILVSCCELQFMQDRLLELREAPPADDGATEAEYTRYIETLRLKEMLVYSRQELHQRLVGNLGQAALAKQRTIAQVVKEFVSDDLYGQRNTLIRLLSKPDDPEFEYMAYLLYDLLSGEGTNSHSDTAGQTALYDSLPWNVKHYFRDAMRTTLQYTNTLAKYDETKIPLEQQICLLKAPDTVKERAMAKLKEVKAKSEDTGSKARQYLEGLLRLPFGIYRKEALLSAAKSIRSEWKGLVERLATLTDDAAELGEVNTIGQIGAMCEALVAETLPGLSSAHDARVVSHIRRMSRSDLATTVALVNKLIRAESLDHQRLQHSRGPKAAVAQAVADFATAWMGNATVRTALCSRCAAAVGPDLPGVLTADATGLLASKAHTEDHLAKITTTLNDAVHGHAQAKRQIERVIGQWMNGEHGGYCFGFEGPPGLGKTSLAKRGLAECLKDSDGTARPFAFIAMGGSSNGSFLQGHSYTYVGSTWGKIADILMDAGCMNPIIFVDELDKISRTEHGKELVGILTHLIDGTQNEDFQDRYFSGVPLDLSRALFVFSYNDAGAIDRILLDRIHRVKFDPLSLADKLVICHKHILPAMLTEAGLTDEVEFSDETLAWLVESYTHESGVRKLKEILFEIVTEINLRLLSTATLQPPVVVTKDDIIAEYLKDRHPVIHVEIPTADKVGVANGLWANSLGRGGIIPIEAHLFPTDTFLDLKLTGMQGDVMKESMNIAKTLVWARLSEDRRKELLSSIVQDKLQGLHVHCPEGATPKDGPSAGVAITIALLSLLTGRAVRRDVGITGEVTLQGNVTAIGGLDLKVAGGMRGGVRTFIFPAENVPDFKKLAEKYVGDTEFAAIKFHPISRIEEAETLALAPVE
jgi:ATP-dependent Lon protease